MDTYNIGGRVIHTGDPITGTYNYRPFTGTVRLVEPNWECGSRNAVNVYVDVPAFEPGRDSLALLGLNLSTGRQYRGMSLYENVTIGE